MSSGPATDLIDLHTALDRLQSDRPRCAEVVRLRLLGGLTVAECARLLEMSERTVKREWRLGRAVVLAELEHDFGPGGV